MTYTVAPGAGHSGQAILQGILEIAYTVVLGARHAGQIIAATTTVTPVGRRIVRATRPAPNGMMTAIVALRVAADMVDGTTYMMIMIITKGYTRLCQE